jgi:hypothetical protein
VGSPGHVNKGDNLKSLGHQNREQMRMSLSASHPRSTTMDTEVPVDAEVLSDCKISDSAVLRLNTRGLRLQL